MVRTKKIILLLFLCVFVACQHQTPEEIGVVNGRSISAEEFIFSYETSPRSVTAGPKETAYAEVLDRLINRVLLSQESQRRGLDQNPETKRELIYLEDAAIRRELFRDRIREKTLIGEDDTRRAYLMAQKTLWIKHIVMKSRLSAKPEFWNPEWKHESINPGTKSVNSPEFGQVDLVGWNDVDTDLESILYDLKLNDWTAPIEKNGQTHLFRLVNFETNQMVTENQFHEQREHYQTAMRKRQEHDKSFEFIQETMKPQNLIIKRPVLEQLTQILWASRVDQDSLTGSPQGEFKEKVLTLDDIGSAVLAHFQSGELTIEDFRFYYQMNPQKLEAEHLDGLRHKLVNAVGIYVRDEVFAEMGRQAELQHREAVREDYQYWQERLLASKLEQQLFDLAVTQSGAGEENYKKMATKDLAELSSILKDQANIKVDQELLLQLKTSDEGLPRKIDFYTAHLN